MEPAVDGEPRIERITGAEGDERHLIHPVGREKEQALASRPDAREIPQKNLTAAPRPEESDFFDRSET